MKAVLEKKVLVPLNIYNERNVPIPNPEYLYVRKEYLELIGNVESENSRETDFIGGMPVQMEKGCLKQLLRQQTYIMTLKVDGERFLMFIASNGIIYFIDRALNFYYFMDDNLTDRLIPLNLKPFLFDGELVTNKDSYEYFIFDCLFYEGVDYTREAYNTRNDVCKFAVDKVFKKYFREATSLITVETKMWFPVYLIEQVADIYNFVIQETNKSRKNRLKADGLILQSYEGKYIPFGPWNRYNNIQFKWKPSNELTIDFKIKVVGNNEWHLYTKTDQPYNISQPEGDPLPATCIPTDLQKIKYSNNEIVEFKYRSTGNPNQNLFVPVRSRPEKEANSLATIMSTMNVVFNPFTLDLLKPAFKFLETKTSIDLKRYLNIFSESDLILCSINFFFTKHEIKEIKKVYTKFQSQERGAELEFRIFKVGKQNKTLDKFTFYYFQDYLKYNFRSTLTETIDLTENKPTKLYKFRSTYRNLIKDIMTGKSIINEYKNKITDYRFEPKNRLFNNLGFKLELAEEVVTDKIIGLRSQFAGKIVNNLIRVKTRYSFNMGNFWRIDLTKVVSAYSLETLKDKNETFEFECEFIGGQETSFAVFIKSMETLYRLIVAHSSYNN